MVSKDRDVDRARDGDGLECVEPWLGEQLWKLDAPGTDAKLLGRLEHHLGICAFCQFALSVQENLARGVRDGTWDLSGETRPSEHPLGAGVGRRARLGRMLAAAGSVGVAASLALILILPPGERPPAGIVRDGEQPARFLRPLPGEVVVVGHPRLSWTPIPGATGYRLTLQEVGGPYLWRGETTATQIQTPDTEPLPPESRIRAYLQPIPADLARTGDVSVTFRRDDLAEYAWYRLGAAPAWISWLGLLGVLSLVGAICLRITGRR